MRSVSGAVLWALMIGLGLGLPIGAQWQPPIGIPAPSFGIENEAPAFTHYVDNTHPNATDSGNPNGSRSVPRLTVPTSLPAGTVVEVHGGPYSTPMSWTGNGTAVAPVFVRGVGEPVFQASNGTLRFFGSFFIVEDVIFDGVNVSLRLPLDHFTIRHCEIRNYSPSNNSSAIGVIGDQIVLYDNHIHDNGDPDSPTEIDIHGIKPDSDTSNLWIVDNHIHDNGGDSVQIGNANSAEPWARFVYIGRNVMHGDRENAVDVKRARDVIVSQNMAFDYTPTSTSAGSGMVFHDQPDRVWVLFNEVFDASIGIISTGVAGYYVIGNLVHDILDATDPGSLFGSEAMHSRNSSEVFFVANTIWNVNKGVSVPSGTSGVEFVGNIIGGLTTASHQIAVGTTTIADDSTMGHNLLGGEARIRWGDSTVYDLVTFQSTFPGQGVGALNDDPRFVDASAGDYRLDLGSSAVDASIAHPVYATFQALYGIDIEADIAGVPRPQGKAHDMGATERQESIFVDGFDSGDTQRWSTVP